MARITKALENFFLFPTWVWPGRGEGISVILSGTCLGYTVGLLVYPFIGEGSLTSLSWTIILGDTVLSLCIFVFSIDSEEATTAHFVEEQARLAAWVNPPVIILCVLISAVWLFAFEKEKTAWWT